MSGLMKKFLFTVLSCALLIGGVAYAQEHEEKKTPATAPSTQPVNKMCVMHPEDPVDNRVTVIYEGKVIGFCCEDCIKDFKKDPKKYMAKLEEQDKADKKAEKDKDKSKDAEKDKKAEK